MRSFLVIAALLSAQAFQPLVTSRLNLRLLAEETDVAPPPPPPPTTTSRLGASIDQDGKSNIWAVEPKMRVEESDSTNGQIIAVTAGAVLALGLIASSFLFINVEQ